MNWTSVCCGLLLLLSACSGHVVVKKHDPTLNNVSYDCRGFFARMFNTLGEKCAKGVPYRITTSQREYLTYTTHPSGRVCQSLLMSRIADNVPGDWRTIAYKPKLFEQHKFSVTLNPNGTLSGTNVESTPVSPEKLVAAIAKAVSGIPFSASPGGQPDPKDQRDPPAQQYQPDQRVPCTEDPLILTRCSLKEECREKAKGELEALKKQQESFHGS